MKERERKKLPRLREEQQNLWLEIKGALHILHDDSFMRPLMVSPEYRGRLCMKIYHYYYILNQPTDAFELGRQTEYLKLVYLINASYLSEITGKTYNKDFIHDENLQIVKCHVLARLLSDNKSFNEVFVLLRDQLFNGVENGMSIDMVKECIEEMVPMLEEDDRLEDNYEYHKLELDDIIEKRRLSQIKRIT